MKRLLYVLTASIFFLLSGCNGISPTSGEGKIRIYLVDSPAVFEEVNIVVERVEVHQADADPESGWAVVNNTAATYDLLELTDGASAVLGEAALSAGHYTQIRLFIGMGSNVLVGGQEKSLTIPSGVQTGVKLIHQFEILEGEMYELTLDFDAARSVVTAPPGQYLLTPVIRIQAD